MILLSQHQKACLRLEKPGKIGTELVTIWFLKDVIKRFELTEIGMYILESIKTTHLGDKSPSVPRDQSFITDPLHVSNI